MIEKLKDFNLKSNHKVVNTQKETSRKIIALEIRKKEKYYEIKNKISLGEISYNTSQELRVFMIKTVNHLANFLNLDTIRLVYEGKFFVKLELINSPSYMENTSINIFGFYEIDEKINFFLAFEDEVVEDGKYKITRIPKRIMNFPYTLIPENMPIN